MARIKISLADAAKKQGCSTDYLLALAEAGEIDVFARIGPYSATFKDWRGRPMPTVGEDGRPLVQFGLAKTGGTSYTTLLAGEVGFLRAGKLVTIRVVRSEGAENGYRFPFAGDEEYLLHLSEPQTVGIEQICLNDDSDGETSINRGAAAVALKPVQRALAQDHTILSEIQALGLDAQALQPAPPGERGPRAAVRESLIRKDSKAYRETFSSNKVFETAWQRLRDAGQIRDASPTPLYPPRKSGRQGG